VLGKCFSSVFDAGQFRFNAVADSISSVRNNSSVSSAGSKALVFCLLCKYFHCRFSQGSRRQTGCVTADWIFFPVAWPSLAPGQGSIFWCSSSADLAVDIACHGLPFFAKLSSGAIRFLPSCLRGPFVLFVRRSPIELRLRSRPVPICCLLRILALPRPQFFALFLHPAGLFVLSPNCFGAGARSSVQQKPPVSAFLLGI
jgi:hypothetical protein